MPEAWSLIEHKERLFLGLFNSLFFTIETIIHFESKIETLVRYFQINYSMCHLFVSPTTHCHSDMNRIINNILKLSFAQLVFTLYFTINYEKLKLKSEIMNKLVCIFAGHNPFSFLLLMSL